MVKVAIALGFAIAFGAAGDILMSIGMKAMGAIRIHRLSELPALVVEVFANPIVLLGVVAMAAYFASYIAALAWVDVSVANPMTALSYLIATVYAAVVLRERVCPMRAAGIACIVLGAIFVGISS